MTFGHIFRHNEIEYVFLTEVDDITYAARILNKETSIKIEQFADSACKNGAKSHLVNKKPLFCYVKLTTEEVKDRLAHVGRAEDKDSKDFGFDEIGCLLNNTDLKRIKEEILDGPVDLLLKEGVKNIDIPEDQSTSDN